jgi:two-component system NtrC family sensor kinase
MKLGLFATLGIAATHAVHLLVTSHVAGEALRHEQERLGRSVARLVAREATEAVLVDDLVALHELVRSSVAGHGVAYCAIVRDQRVLATTLPARTAARFVRARGPRDHAPVVLVSGDRRLLDLAEPILQGRAGWVRVGVDMGVIGATTREVGVTLGLLAISLTLIGLVAAFVVGRAIARPVVDLVQAAERFDPSRDPPLVTPRGGDEIRELTERFNRMMVRLRAAYFEQERARQKQAGTERMAALGSLVAGVAHEVNNPLAGMKNCLRRLQRSTEPRSPKQQEYLELMEEGLERIEDVMRGLLDFARPRTLELREVAVRDVVREGTSLLRPVLARRQIALQTDDCDLRVVADRKHAGQALLNLLLNASHVTPDGGEIRLKIRQRPGLCGIAVEDDGPGIPQDLRERVLDPFFSTKPEGAGTGLGLPVTKSILDAHGGELTFEFPGRGTVATVWLRVPAIPA